MNDHPHDTGYKLLFSAPEMVRDLILGFVPDDWLHGLDFNTLEKVPGNYVSDDQKEREDDVVWRIQAGGDWVYLYLLIEFQSTIDPHMALRMMVYVGLLYQDLLRRQEIPNDGRLPPVLPIVLYNGTQRWNAATQIADLIAAVPGMVDRFKPHMEYLLIDEGGYTDKELRSLKNLMAAAFRLEQQSNPDNLGEIIDQLIEWLWDRPDLRRIFALWIWGSLMRRAEFRMVLPKVNDLQELNMALADRVDQWAKEIKAEGIEQGMQQGEALSLQKLLKKRLGDISPAMLSRISQASQAQIETWFERAIDAASLDDVFRD
jgi:hypothetical protein